MDQNDPNAIHFMSVVAIPSQYSSADKSYGRNAYNGSILADEHHSFNTFDPSLILDENDDLNIDEFINAISHGSTLDKFEEESKVGR